MRRSIVLVAGEVRLLLRADGVDVARLRQRRQADVQLAGPLEQLVEQELGALAADLLDQGIERVDPVLGLVGIGVGWKELEVTVGVEHIGRIVGDSAADGVREATARALARPAYPAPDMSKTDGAATAATRHDHHIRRRSRPRRRPPPRPSRSTGVALGIDVGGTGTKAAMIDLATAELVTARVPREDAPAVRAGRGHRDHRHGRRPACSPSTARSRTCPSAAGCPVPSSTAA